MFQINSAPDNGIICTVIMPIYNRVPFLKQAFNSLSKQTFKNWRLIVVDDGSNDSPIGSIKELTNHFEQPVYFIERENGGPGAARQTGISASPECDYFAFFDSDDEWAPNYLDDAISRLEAYPSIDWLYVACKRVQHDTGKTIQDSTFWLDSKTPVRFFKLEAKTYEDVHCFADNQAVIVEQIREPINAGFQNSVLRSRIFKSLKIPHFRIGEDRHLVVSALVHGYKLAYLDKANVIYHVHDSNISDTNKDQVNFEKKLFVQQELLASYQDLLTSKELEAPSRKALSNECANVLFWHIGYQTFAPQGLNKEALKSMFTALRYRPTNLKFYKTMIVYLARLLLKA